MNTIFLILTILIVIAAILLVAVVLLQNGKGDGMASNFVAGNQAFGVRQTADILEKITWSLVAGIIVLSIVSAFTLRTTTSGTDISGVAQEQVDPTPVEMDAPSVPAEAAADAEASEPYAETE